MHTHYIHSCMHAYMCMCVGLYTYIKPDMDGHILYVCMYINTHILTYIFCIHLCACMYICYIRVYILVCI